MRFLRSLRTRLTLLFFCMTLIAVGVVYFYVTPRLESSLRQEKLDSLAGAAREYASPIQRAIDDQVPGPQLDRAVRRAADRANARVTLLGVNTGTLAGLQTYPISDSTEEAEIRDLQFGIATDAARARHGQTGSESSNEGPLGQAALPIVAKGRVTHVLVFAAPLADVDDNVALIRRQILRAGLLALGLSLVFGIIVSTPFARRVIRLERGAEKVASGDFTARFPTQHLDELGQLARALDDMQRQLAELDSARKRFIATASHELRTPIFSLAGFLELLEDEDLDDETRRHFIAQVREQVARLGTLATSLLDLSRLEAGSLELRPERTDVAMLTRAVASEFEPALQATESHLRLRLDGERLEAVCDPERVAQVLRILIDNAIVHTPAGTDLTVFAGRSDGRLRISVRDDGPGIRRDALGRIFEPFFTSDDVQGSGLGLAIARELAERMRG
ncbi:MAG: HAMP domain-containing histidine kinase, partial [Solirubrobacteraceae bacterium]|nr:HAMP domain-containing histidine kinase [Solirubrobacteraceae bacterium]